MSEPLRFRIFARGLLSQYILPQMHCQMFPLRSLIYGDMESTKTFITIVMFAPGREESK